MKSSLLIIVILALFILPIGCMGPPNIPDIIEIQPNESAFVIQLEGDTKEGQAQFGSVEFLEESKVASKRIIVEKRKRKTGRMPWNYERIATARVIRVDRAPVTREWTEADTKGTSNMNEAITVESKDSIGFNIGVTITARVEEKNTATFLYYFPSKSLGQIVDTIVRGYVQSFLSTEFGKTTLEDGRARKKEIFDKCFKGDSADESVVGVVEHFKKFGITVDNLGYSEGLTYENPKIQAAIDGVFVSARDREVAKMEQEAQTIRNKTELSVAETDARRAREIAKNTGAFQLKTELEIKQIYAKAALMAAEKWSGNLPTHMMPSDAGMGVVPFLQMQGTSK